MAGSLHSLHFHRLKHQVKYLSFKSMQQHLSSRLWPASVSLILCGALCSPFVPFAINDCYFRLFPMAVGTGLACVTALILALKFRSGTFRFTWPDGLVTAGVAWYLLRYDYSLHLADWKVIYAALLWLLWWAARIMFSLCSDVRKYLPVCLSLLGCLLAGWGMLQLYGWASPGHPLFRITGPFFNPGPYSGYLSLLLPVSLYGTLTARGWLRSLHVLSILSMICILPAAMSRSAWIAIAVSLLWVAAMRQGWLGRLRAYYRKHPRKTAGWVAAGCVVIALAGTGLFLLKADSARGRLLIWKNTFRAVSEQPIAGYGVGRFPSVYGRAQADYFASGQATDTEKWVAGYVEYAFNDYLQLALEGGVVLLLLVLGWGVLVFRSGMRMREYGACGALLAFAIFALASYPLQVLPFGIMIVVLGTSCVTIVNTQSKKRIHFVSILSLLLCMGSGLIVWNLRQLPQTAKAWKQADILYYNNFYEDAIGEYKKLYPCLMGTPAFLWNYALALSESQRYEEACYILEREQLVSCNANIWNRKGYCLMKAGKYKEAEMSLYYSLLLTPERIYPYYLLARLYSKEGFFNKEKALEMANIVLTKSPKKHSAIIDEMRTEIRTLYNTLNY